MYDDNDNLLSNITQGTLEFINDLGLNSTEYLRSNAPHDDDYLDNLIIIVICISVFMHSLLIYRETSEQRPKPQPDFWSGSNDDGSDDM